MSYSRWPIYIWSDATRIHLWVDGNDPAVTKARCGSLDEPEMYDRTAGVHMPIKMFDELVLCRYAEMIKDGLVQATARRIQQQGRRESPFRGNFGSWDILKALGEDPAAEFQERIAEALARRQAAEEAR